MKFYDTTKNLEGADPCSINIGGLSLYFTSMDAIPFIVFGDKVYFGARGTEHSDIQSHYKIKGGEQGRFWANENALAFWGWASDCHQDALRKVCMALKRLGVDISKVRYFTDFALTKTSEHPFVKFAVEVPVLEYLNLNIYGNPGEFFWHIWKKGNKVGKEQKIASNGMSNRDIWRHWEINESDIRQMVQESLYLLNKFIA